MRCALHPALAARARSAHRRARAGRSCGMARGVLAATTEWPGPGSGCSQQAAALPPLLGRTTPLHTAPEMPPWPANSAARGQGLAKAEMGGRGWRRDGLALIKQQRSLRRTGWTCNRKTPENPAAAGNNGPPVSQRDPPRETHRETPTPAQLKAGRYNDSLSTAPATLDKLATHQRELGLPPALTRRSHPTPVHTTR